MKQFIEKKNYLEKNRFTKRMIDNVPDAATHIIVVIPCFNEPDVLKTLQSLAACDETKCITEVIVIINSGDDAGEEIINFNSQTEIEIKAWISKSTSALKFFVYNVMCLPAKHAGVGLARKIGMDEAADRFDQIKNSNGIIICLDADCLVEKNYLNEIENHFELNPDSTGCSIYFEHPLNGELDNQVYNAIISYELFLRYYNLSLKFSGFPYAYHTIGSSMAVRNFVYQKQGGMNRKKAGEDFYFLHKIFPLGNFAELNSTTVYPSPRISNRVPFGTGSAVNKFVNSGFSEFLTYNFQIFVDLENFFSSIGSFYDEPIASNFENHNYSPALKSFLDERKFREKIVEIQSNASTKESFIKRFYNWFDGFMVLKFVHYATEKFYPKEEILIAVKNLSKALMWDTKIDISNKKVLLLLLRKTEKYKS